MAALSALRANYFKVEDTINWMQNSNNNKIASNASVSIMKSLLYKKKNIDFLLFWTTSFNNLRVKQIHFHYCTVGKLILWSVQLNFMTQRLYYEIFRDNFVNFVLSVTFSSKYAFNINPSRNAKKKYIGV